LIEVKLRSNSGKKEDKNIGEEDESTSKQSDVFATEQK